MYIDLTFYSAFVSENGIKVKDPDRRIYTTLEMVLLDEVVYNNSNNQRRKK
jgi:hypothetical protein